MLLIRVMYSQQQAKKKYFFFLNIKKSTCLENLIYICINVFILFMDIYFFIMCIWNKVQPFYPLTTVRYVGNLFNSQDDVENNLKVILTFIAE